MFDPLIAAYDGESENQSFSEDVVKMGKEFGKRHTVQTFTFPAPITPGKSSLSTVFIRS
jgi:hypothetical protein